MKKKTWNEIFRFGTILHAALVGVIVAKGLIAVGIVLFVIGLFNVIYLNFNVK